jgi:ElaB/YqjD/DUF883 family membrane-anchored ribosome-binding protein
MPDALAGLACSGCRDAVFDGRPVVRCSKCGAYCHQECFVKTARCPVQQCAGKKWEGVAVVRLEPPGPDVREIAAAVRADFEDVLHPLMAGVRSDMAQHEDVEKLHAEVLAAAKAAQTRDEALRARLDSTVLEIERALAEHARAIAETQRLVRALPTVGPKEFGDVAQSVAASVGERTERLRESVHAALDALRQTVSVESRRNLVAIEACRWDTAAHGRPLPWDEGAARVLNPAPPPLDPSDTRPGRSS